MDKLQSTELQHSQTKPSVPGSLTMLRPHTLHRFISCMLLLHVSLFSSGESRPHTVHEGTPDVYSQRDLLLEAVKIGILGSLGMDREPQPAKKASEQELRKMYQLYREKLREMRANSSQPMRETWQPTMSTVLFPTTVVPVKVHQGEELPQTDHLMQWYRAVFHKNPNIKTESILARAELKIAKQILKNPTSVQPDVSQEIHVKVNGMKTANSVAWTHVDSVVRADVSSTQDVMLNISPEVEKWMRADSDQSLVVDVGMVLSERDALKVNPTISLELGLTHPKPARKRRQPRSNKEDNCDERGWCCRKSLTVSFKEIGWTDWVVAPTEYTMHYCDGTCPHNYKPASMHTQVKSRMHQITKGGTPRPCCVPAAYEPMVLMHYDSRGILKLTPFEDLIVSKCHCA